LACDLRGSREAGHRDRGDAAHVGLLDRAGRGNPHARRSCCQPRRIGRSGRRRDGSSAWWKAA